MTPRSLLASLSALVLVLLIVPASPAVAEPATVVTYPAGATATRFSGLAFDTCTAPTYEQMKAWRASPYDAIGVYIGGPNRTCAQPQLTPTWVSQVSRMGFRIVPIYMGRQAPCTFRGPGSVNISSSQATEQGTWSAADAVSKAKALGLLPGSAIYGDMEHYDVASTSCRTTVLKYLSAWTKGMHKRGYVSAVYAHLNSGAQHLSQTYSSTAYARPDALWIARWDLNDSLSNWPGIPNAQWANGQRAKQYRGDHNETHGGVTLNIDSDRFNAPMATVAFRYRVTSTGPLTARSGPGSSYPAVRTHPSGSTLSVVCQTPGSSVGGSVVWDKLADGTYVADRYVSTPSNTTYSWPIPRCRYPFQVTSPDALTKRTGPGTSYSSKGSLPPGSLAWVVCQKTGSTVGSTRVWNKLHDDTWVTDYYVATASNTSFTKPIPRC